MNVNEAVDRLRRAHAGAGLGRIAGPGRDNEAALAQIAETIAPLRLPDDLVSWWRAVDQETLAVAPGPRPADPVLALRHWRAHLEADPVRRRFFPWCSENHEFVLVELADEARPGGDCYSWSGGPSPLVRTFPSVGAYVDLLATMIELREFVHHPQIGVYEFDPARTWTDAQVVRLAASADRPGEPAALTTIGALLAQSIAGESPSGTIRARVVAVSGTAAGRRMEVTDGTGRLDIWSPASLGPNGPIIERQFEFDVTVRPDWQPSDDVADDLGSVERATRRGDLRAAVVLAAPLYDRVFGTPAAAQATAIRLVG
jgi:hypothetical protein